MTATPQLRNNRILVIDDNPAIHDDIRKILRCRGGDAEADPNAAFFDDPPPTVEGVQISFQVDTASQGEEGLRMIEAAAAANNPYAMAFVDIRMPPGWDGVETVSRIWQQFPDLQVVICTAYSDYSWEGMVRKIGRSDSLLILKKPFDNIEVLQLANALTQKWNLNHEVSCRLNNLDQLVSQRTAELQSANERLRKEIADRIQAQQSLRLSEERFSKAFKASPIPLAIQSLLNEEFVDANDGFLRLLGHGRDELIGQTARQLRMWDDGEAESAMLQKLRREMSVRNLSCHFRSKSGVVLEILLSVEVIELDGKPFLLIIAQDISEQIKLENQLRQAQKMEAVGQLAAGVAHDFNNILTIVQGNASLLLAAKEPESPDTRPLQNICAAADRAAKLVRQLLTFSRKQVVEMRPTNLSDLTTAVAEMLPRVLTPVIKVSTAVSSSLPQISADRAMLETLLMNLAVNARDAMPNGGTLSISADAVTLGGASPGIDPEAVPGQYIRLSVADTGCGIAPEILPRIFEPFFTTKPVGKGTGLGLATVYGIVRQHQGWVEVHSEVNKGTTFRVFLPALAFREPQPAPAPPKPAAAERPRETVLVVDDEPDLRDLVVQVLESGGYRVLSAGSGTQALEQWAKRVGEIHLLLTDIVMPDGMTGQALAQRLRSEDPRLRVIYTSGYTAGMPGLEMANMEEQNFLPKPYRPAALLNIVRECLDKAPRAPACASDRLCSAA
jgi:PAS domain S-box-containing protein